MQLINSIILATSLLSSISTAVPALELHEATLYPINSDIENISRCMYPSIDACMAKSEDSTKLHTCIMEGFAECAAETDLMTVPQEGRNEFPQEIRLGWEQCRAKTNSVASLATSKMEIACRKVQISRALDKFLNPRHRHGDLDSRSAVDRVAIKTAVVETYTRLQ